MAAPLLLPGACEVRVDGVVSWETGCDADHPMRLCCGDGVGGDAGGDASAASGVGGDATVLMCQVEPRLVGSDIVVKVSGQTYGSFPVFTLVTRGRLFDVGVKIF